MMKEFKQPQDVIVVIKDLKNPADVLREALPKMTKMLKEFGLVLRGDATRVDGQE